MTIDELLVFCAKNDFYAIEQEPDGELSIMAPAGGGTGRKNTQLILCLAQWAERDGRGIAFGSNIGFTLPDGSMRSPDSAWVSAKRWQALSQEDKARFPPVCPEFIIELRSPSDALLHLQRKMDMWIANGAELAWLIDPIEKSVTVYRLAQPPECLHGITEVNGEGPVHGFVLPLRSIFD